MFNQLFKCQATIRRHLKAPYSQERQQYLAAQARQGNTRSTLLFTARDLLWVARKLSIYPDLRTVTMQQVCAVADDWAGTRPRRGHRDTGVIEFLKSL